MSNPATVIQADPTANSSRPVWELVIEDMRARDQVGRAKYGTPLRAHNGRDALVDAYQEALDLCVYLRQAIEERAPTDARRCAIWEAINEYTAACGGDTSNRTISDRRMNAVAAVERAING